MMHFYAHQSFNDGIIALKLLVIETCHLGHRMALNARYALIAAIRKEWSVTLMTTGEALRSPAFNIISQALGVHLSVYKIRNLKLLNAKDVFRQVIDQMRMYFYIKRAFNEYRNEYGEPDLIYIPGLEDFSKALSIFGTPFGGVFFSATIVSVKFHRHTTGIGPSSRLDKLDQRLFLRMLAIPSLKCLLSVDPVFFDYVCKNEKFDLKKICYLPDQTNVTGCVSLSKLRSSLGIGDDKFVILVFGTLTERKNIELLLDVVSSYMSHDFIVLLAGKPDGFVQSLLNTEIANRLRSQGRLLELLKFCSIKEENELFCSADVVWLNYRDFYSSSGVMYSACAAGCPVIASQLGASGWEVNKHKIGLVVDPCDVFSVSGALMELYNDTYKRNFFAKNARALSKLHNAETYLDILSTKLFDTSSDR